jgi:hypothetical protein
MPATAPTPTPTEPIAASAGSIVVKDLTTSTDITTLTYDTAQGYSYLSSLQPLWNAGDSMSVHAPGDVVPAFSATVTIPPMIAGLSPTFAIGDGPRPTMTRGQDFVVRWTPVASGRNLAVTFVPYFTDDRGNPTIECEVADSDGQLVIPGELLAFPGVAAQFPVTANIGIVRTQPAPVSDVTGDVAVIATASAGGQLDLQ